MTEGPAIPTPLAAVTWISSADTKESAAAEIVVEFVSPASNRPEVEIPGDAGGRWQVRVDRHAGDACAGDGIEDRGKPWRAAGATLIRALRERAARRSSGGVDIVLTVDIDDLSIEALVIGLVAGSHELRLSGSGEERHLPHVRLVSERDVSSAVRRGNLLGRATAFARDLANLPSNLKSPQGLAEYARRALASANVDFRVRDERWLLDRGFGGVLAVGGGSSEPPRFMEISWAPPESAGEALPHVVLVGKGITFDTGGISVKPPANMHLMKTDMAGGAAVLAAVSAIADLAPRVRVTALVPSAENMLSGSAYRPGDVVTHYGGLTTEVSNTDAEGRMVLADALAYAVEDLAPDVLIDIATLTGAMKVALGMRTGAVFTADAALDAAIRNSGSAVGERWWRLPLSEEHAEAVRSTIADLRQAPGGPGAITAALFLKEFAGDARWVHLDIAGPARSEDAYDEVNPVASGFGARTLATFVEWCAENVEPARTPPSQP
ncbi:leucyl aminopeptidase family protein [Hoyosella altamirensis]|uniref:Probable cytosol aminopeptidase n=1 Tax=Hoyosella altamirensis TaxID=616997 RepID=A0A839RJ40_9ACTN|nr:M17 family metallopeptidase [Hoyosella altamirensis]MBB3036103.1 leucyl aminopeptidase [Hoyosella altamirensis]